MPMAQVSRGAASYLFALRHRSFLPRRIPPELRCRDAVSGLESFPEKSAGTRLDNSDRPTSIDPRFRRGSVPRTDAIYGEPKQDSCNRLKR